MIAPRSQRSVVTWLACLAFLLASFAPSITQALQRDAGISWAEICTTSVTNRLLPVNGTIGAPAPELPAKHLLKHCPYCHVQVPALGMPPAHADGIALLPLGAAEPENAPAAPCALHAWSPAQARAPPRES